MSGKHGVLGLLAQRSDPSIQTQISFRMGRALATGIETVELLSSTL